jgi:8-oxo-dGTP pyrophosphatase MutT (NUDIX family)
MLTRWFHGYALVRRIESAGTRWLILRSADGEWDLVHGERQKKESFRETASRAVSEQLGLNPAQDFLVSTMNSKRSFRAKRLQDSLPSHFIRLISIVPACWRNWTTNPM